MEEIAAIIFSILSHTKPNVVPKTGQPSKAQFLTEPEALEAAQQQVRELLGRFPLYPEIEI